MSDPILHIGAEGIDVEETVNSIRRKVEENRAKGEYADPVLARAERYNLANLKDKESFLPYYLSCLREAAEVDISDFEIVERRKRFAGALVGLKNIIWKLLKFYTYRLWSQQNQINALLLGAIEGLHDDYNDRIEKLEKKIEQLQSPGDKS